MIINKIVVWMSEPDTGWSLISVKKRPGSNCLHNQVVINVVLCLNSILNEDSVSLSIISNVIFNSKVVGTMKSEGSVVAIMDSVVLGIRLMDSTDHVEMDSVSSDLEGLPYVMEFNSVDSSYH